MNLIGKYLYNIKLAFSYRDIISTRCRPIFTKMIQEYHESFVRSMVSLKGKKKIKVAFFITTPGMWKADYVYRLMDESPLFEPYMVVLPYSSFKGFSENENIATLVRTEEFVKRKGYRYIIPFNKETKKWLDIRDFNKPDIVFFSSPYKDNVPEYYIYHYKDTPTFYIPYSFTSMNCYKINYDLVFPNLVGCYFVETPMHIEFGRRFGRSKAVNYQVVGYPGSEIFFRKDYKSQDVWRKQDREKKRVIWAPHHSIDQEGGLKVSCFLECCDEMLQISEKYKDSIQFAFKPHQRLKFKLKSLWGVEKTESYYNKWKELENCQLEESDYVDLFIHSDAMIHDSGSFTTEYLFLNKPVMYLVKNERDIRSQFNDFGIKAFEQHYQGISVKCIEDFLQKVVLEGQDSMKVQRQIFYDDYLVSRDGLLPSERILKYIEELVNK